jgi:hypothetical protein
MIFLDFKYIGIFSHILLIIDCYIAITYTSIGQIVNAIDDVFNYYNVYNLDFVLLNKQRVKCS